jgi:hypothetical protein
LTHLCQKKLSYIPDSSAVSIWTEAVNTLLPTLSPEYAPLKPFFALLDDFVQLDLVNIQISSFKELAQGTKEAAAGGGGDAQPNNTTCQLQHC